MHSKNQLLIFSRREVLTVVALLILVAMLSFTVGIRMGRELSGGRHSTEVTSPFRGQEPDGHSSDEHAADEHAAAKGGGGHDAAGHGAPAPSKQLDLADPLLEKEVVRERVGTGAKIATAIPTGKRTEASGGRFTLQVGSHRTVAEAADQVAALKRQGFEAFYMEVTLPHKGTWYRVGIGVYPSKEAAESGADDLKKEKSLPPFIVQKVNE